MGVFEFCLRKKLFNVFCNLQIMKLMGWCLKISEGTFA